MKWQLIWYFSMPAFGIFILGAWVWSLSRQVHELSLQVAQCNTEKLDIMQRQNAKLESTLWDIRNYMYQPHFKNGKD